MKCAFMASDAVAIPAMRALHERGLLACAVSNPDKPKGRGKQMSPNPAAEWVLANNIPLLRPEKSPSHECVDWMESYGVDFIMVMAYGKILREEIINFPPLGCLNLHGSLLPHLRGASPIETAIALGDSKTGVTLMRIVKKMDAGDMCGKIETSIGARENGADLRVKIADLAAKLLCEKLSAIESRALEFVPQYDANATYSRKLSKADMHLDFNKPARECDCRIRAFGGGLVPWNGAVLKICEAFAEGNDSRQNVGEVVEVSGNGICVACSEGMLRITRLQAPCAKEMSAADFLKGREICKGEIFASTAQIPLLKIC